MSRTSLQDTQSVQDPQYAYNFDLIFQTIPGAGSNAAQEVRIKCTSTTIPESTLEQVVLENKSSRLHFAGRRVWSGTWNATMFETRSGSTRDSILGWQELARSLVANTGTYKTVYSVVAEIVLYDDVPNVVRRIRVHGVFPTSTGSPQLSSASEIVNYDVTFSYDYTEDVPV